jgi:hypothetical protein
MVIKYTKIFHSKTLQNLPKLGILVWKQTIWQPWQWPKWRKFAESGHSGCEEPSFSGQARTTAFFDSLNFFLSLQCDCCTHFILCASAEKGTFLVRYLFVIVLRSSLWYVVGLNLGSNSLANILVKIRNSDRGWMLWPLFLKISTIFSYIFLKAIFWLRFMQKFKSFETKLPPFVCENLHKIITLIPAEDGLALKKKNNKLGMS